MKFVGDSERLGSAAGFAARHTAGAARALPALAGLRMRADGDRVRLTGYDYEAGSTVTISAVVDEPGEVLVPGRVFAEIVRALPPGEVFVAATDSEVSVTASAIDFSLPVMSLADYPELPPSPPLLGTVDGDALAAAATHLARVASRDDAVPILSGVLVELGPTSIRATSCDRYRVAIADLPWQPTRAEALRQPLRAVVPAQLFAETAKALDPTARVGVGLGADNDALLTVTDGTRGTTMRLLDGRYPPLHTKVPTEFAGTATFGAQRLAAALRRVGIVADRHAAVLLRFDAEEIDIGAEGEVDARGRERIPARLDGERATVAFNAGYLLDGLAALDGATAQLSYAAGMRPALLTAAPNRPGCEAGEAHPDESPPTAFPTPAAPRFRYVVMPRRLPSDA